MKAKDIMKRSKPKSRHALALFHGDSPFKQKIEKDPKKYTRKVKHKKAELKDVE